MDLNDLINELESSISYIEEEVPKLRKDLGDIAAKSIKNLTPTNTGKLRDSIEASVQGESVTIGSTVDYAEHVEFGHMQKKRYVPEIEKTISAKFVKGSHMFENGMLKAEPELDNKVEDFLNNLPIFK